MNTRQSRLLLIPMLIAAAGPALAAHPEAGGPPAHVTPAPESSLLVGGQLGRYSVSAVHADVQTMLKALFDRADRQFILPGGLDGRVTLRLVSQPFRVILDAVCAQSLLQYRVDPLTGIYRFAVNETAVRTAFRFRMLNANVAEAARMLSRPAARDAFGSSGPPTARKAAAPATPYPGLKEPGESVRGLSAQAQTVPLVLYTRDRFAGFNIQRGKPLAVTVVLQDMARQARVPIFTDSSVPASAAFRIEGRITPRPLPEALNALSLAAHLTWKWAGDRVVVSAAPDLWSHYGDSLGPAPQADGQQPAEPDKKPD